MVLPSESGIEPPAATTSPETYPLQYRHGSVGGHGIDNGARLTRENELHTTLAQGAPDSGSLLPVAIGSPQQIQHYARAMTSD